MLKRNDHVPWLEETRSPYKFFVTRIRKEDTRGQHYGDVNVLFY